MLKLRGHHLLCTLNYSGSGYTPKFISNLDDICARLSAGEPARLTWQPDSICQPMLGHPECHCHQWEFPWRDFWGFAMTSLVLRRWYFPPRVVVLDKVSVAKLRAAFATHTTRMACVGCSWFSHCSAIAKVGWPKSKLHSLPKR